MPAKRRTRSPESDGDHQKIEMVPADSYEDRLTCLLAAWLQEDHHTFPQFTDGILDIASAVPTALTSETVLSSDSRVQALNNPSVQRVELSITVAKAYTHKTVKLECKHHSAALAQGYSVEGKLAEPEVDILMEHSDLWSRAHTFSEALDSLRQELKI